MRLNIDSGKILYGLGVVFAAAALLYFSRDVVFGLSITVKAGLLALSFVAFFIAGIVVHRDVLDTVSFVLAGVTYVVFVGYVVFRYEPSETGIFLLFAVSAGLFVTLGYAIRELSLSLSRQTGTVIITGVLVVSTVLIGADALGGGVSHELTTESSVTVEPVSVERPDGYHQVRAQIGTMTATNGFVFRRALSLPPLRGCLSGVSGLPEEDVWVDYTTSSYERSGTIAGGATVAYDVEARLPVAANRTEPLTYAIEHGTDCDTQRSEPTLIVAIETDQRLD